MAAIGLWGFAYMSMCFQALTAPGRPLEFRYVSPGGPLTLRAAGFAYDPVLGVLRAQRLSLTDPYGRPLASVESVSASGLKLITIGQAPIAVRLTKAYGRLELMPNGRPKFLDYLPEPAKERAQTPYSVEVKDLVVDVFSSDRDLTRARTPFAKVRGVADRWIANGSPLRLSEGGVINAIARQSDSNGLEILAAAKDAALTRFVDFVASTPEGKKLRPLQDLRFARLDGAGNYWLRVPRGGSVRLLGSVALRGEDVRYGREFGASSAEYVGNVTANGASGVLTARGGQVQSRFEGALRWAAGKTTVAGGLLISAPSDRSLPAWLRQRLPKGSSFSSGRYEGWLAYEPSGGVALQGKLQSARIRYAGEELRDGSALVRVTPTGATARIQQAVWNGAKLQGFVGYSTGSRSLSGLVEAKNVQLSKVAKLARVDGLTGAADASFVFDGPIAKPLVGVSASGDAELRLDRGQRRVRLGRFELASGMNSSARRSARLTIEGPNGRLAARGGIDISSGRLDVDLFGAGLPLKRVSQDLRGFGAVAAKVTGTFKKPLMTARAEVYDAAYQDQKIPAAFANVRATRSAVSASDIQAIVGVFPATGNLAVSLADRTLSGSIQATAFLTDFSGAAAGSARLSVTNLGGTLARPRARIVAASDRAFISGVEIKDLLAQGNLNGKLLSGNVRAKVGEGELNAAGSYSLDRKTGSVQGSVTGVPIEQIAANLQDTAKLEGFLDASRFSATFGPQGIILADAAGEIRRLEVNDTLFDGGPWELGNRGDEWTGSARLGVLERFIQVPSFRFNSKSRQLAAEVSTLDLDVQPLVAALMPYLRKPDSPDQQLKPVAELSPDAQEKLKSLRGLASLAMTVSGPLSDLDISEGILDLKALELDKRAAGNVRAEFTRRARAWDLERFLWTDGPGRLELTGRIEERGNTELNGELNNFDLNWLSVFSPSLSNIYGSGDVSFLVSGPTKRPNVSGSVTASLLEPPSAVMSRERVVRGLPVFGTIAAIGQVLGSVTLPDIETAMRNLAPKPETVLAVNMPFTLAASPDNAGDYVLDASGNIHYKVFSGDISAQFPLEGLFELSKTKEWRASITAAERPITADQIAAFLGSLDPARTNLVASGNVAARGIGSAWSLDGLVSVKKNPQASPGSSAIGVAGLDTSLTDLSTEVSLKDEIVTTTVKATGSNGGTADGTLTASVGKPSELLSSLVSGSMDKLLDAKLDGRLGIKDLALREVNILESSPGEKGSAVAKLSGDILLDQTIGRPRIRTPEGQPLLVAGGDFILPTFPETDVRQAAPRIVPAFDVAVALAEPARMRAGNAILTVTGSGLLGGNLATPQLEAQLAVVEGMLRLPTARVQIEEGGSLRLQYRARPGDAEAFARLDVDLRGSTSLTALRFGSLVERYDIDLFIRGDLLGKEPIGITAQSTPGDLSTQQILRMLGQADLLESLTASVRTSLGDRNIQQAIQTFAIPALFDPLTEELARQLGLDYLAIEYNALEQTTFTAAKSLGKGLTLQYRRQLFEPTTREKQRYDLRLTYRIPGRNPLLNRLTLLIGADQDRPWKIGLEYSTRF